MEGKLFCMFYSQSTGTVINLYIRAISVEEKLSCQVTFNNGREIILSVMNGSLEGNLFVFCSNVFFINLISSLSLSLSLSPHYPCKIKFIHSLFLWYLLLLKLIKTVISMTLNIFVKSYNYNYKAGNV